MSSKEQELSTWAKVKGSVSNKISSIKNNMNTGSNTLSNPKAYE